MYDGGRMDKNILKGYRGRVIRINKLEQDIINLQGKDVPCVNGKVQASMRDFPYLRTRETIVMSEPYAAEKIVKALEKKRAEIQRLQELNAQVDNFIDGIDDDMARSILECYYTDGLERVTQKEVADKLNIKDKYKINKILLQFINT